MTIVTRTQTLKLSEIKPTKPNRLLNAGHVKDLVDSLGSTAFATAIVVRPIEKEGEYGWEVVAGFHRIEAAKLAGQTEVHVIVVEGATDLELELIQIDENILHRPLTLVQEARALARRKQIYQDLNPATKRGGDRRANNQSGSLHDARGRDLYTTKSVRAQEHQALRDAYQRRRIAAGAATAG